MAGTANAKGQMSGFAAHGRNHKPVAAGTGIFINRAGNFYAFFLGRLVAKSRASLGQGQVVVNGFRHMDVLDFQPMFV